MIVVIGNAPLNRDFSALVDSADQVIRFNEPRTFNKGSGTRFDTWVIANLKGGRYFARQRIFRHADYRTRPRQIWFPRCAGVHSTLLRGKLLAPNLAADSDVDYSAEIVKQNKLPQKNQLRFSESFYWSCIEQLYDLNRPEVVQVKIPSTGFMAVHYLLSVLSAKSVTLIGFSWQGWEGHPWEKERQVLEKWAKQGLITIL